MNSSRPRVRSKNKQFDKTSKLIAPDNRVKLVFGILAISIFALIGRMAWLQLIQAPKLESEARVNQTSVTEPLGARRSIVDRKGRLLAIDEERFRVWAHPNNFYFPGDDTAGETRMREEVVEKISKFLPNSSQQLIDKLTGRRSGVRLVEGLSEETANQIMSLGISGLELEPYLERIYPQGSLVANIVGFLNQERVAQAGLEQSLNQDLLRDEKSIIIRTGYDGTPLPDGLSPGFYERDSQQLHLTLDARLQELSVNALKEQVDKWNADKGVAIVMNVNNGELLALASTPTYDPNKYWEYSPSLFREWSVQDLFDPGSTFKPINLAIALQEGVIDPSGTVNDTGRIKIGSETVYNHDGRANGKIDFATVLKVSSNVGMINVMTELDPGDYWDWLQKLGIDRKPQTDLPGAVAGLMQSRSQFISQPIAPATASFGQGFSLTPLKLAQLHALIANGGTLVSPHVTRGLHGNNGWTALYNPSTEKIFRAEVTEVVRSWMESVVEEGSGVGVKTDGYRIGGKTGTAEKLVNGVYLPGTKICSFVAHLPVDDPQYLILVVVDEPKGKRAFGSTVAVPVAKKIIEGLLVLEQIPPIDS